MSTNRALALVLLTAAGLTVAACGTVNRALGGGKVTPDEFRITTKPPLVVPPEYALRPPAPGEPRAAELAPESAARNALLGRRENLVRSPGEQLLTAKAGADRADPLVRYVVDDEFGDLAHKERSWADRLLFWRKDGSQTQAANAQAAGANTAAPVDAAAEEQRIAALTGGQQVVIQRQRPRRFKLPGL